MNLLTCSLDPTHWRPRMDQSSAVRRNPIQKPTLNIALYT